jgi:hypothetical protein
MTDERSVEELISWLNERLDNCQRIAAQKRGADRMGWLEDASYFRDAAAALLREKARADEAEKALDTLIAAFASHPVSSIIKAKARKSLAAALSSEQSKEGK